MFWKACESTTLIVPCSVPSTSTSMLSIADLVMEARQSPPQLLGATLAIASSITFTTKTLLLVISLFLNTCDYVVYRMTIVIPLLLFWT
ncbi:unnamed protein product, partial [Cylicocyclus nassatus]